MHEARVSYKPKKAVVHLYVIRCLVRNIALQLEETGPLNASCSLACTAELTQSTWLLI